LWIEYSVPADFETQKRIIRHLRKWIEGIDEQGFVRGFAFDHYFGGDAAQSDLRVRFDYPDEINPEIESELETKIKELIPEFSLHSRPWDSDEEILRGYEFGSRCAFLFWQMVEKGRFPEEYLSGCLTFSNSEPSGLNVVPFNFQSHFYHGIMNSLGVPKIPHELLLHLLAIIESKHFHSQEDLFAWVRTLPPKIFRTYG
jgi:hypothetical protein